MWLPTYGQQKIFNYRKNTQIFKTMSHDDDNFMDVSMRFNPHFVLKTKLPNSLSMRNLMELSKSYIKINQKFSQSECIGLCKRFRIQSNLNLDQMVELVFEACLINLEGLKLSDFGKNVVEFDVYFGEVNSKQVLIYQRYKWLRNVEILMSQIILDMKEYKQIQKINFLTNQFIVTIRPLNQINMFRLFYYPKIKIQSFNQVEGLYMFQKIFSKNDNIFSEQLIESFRTNKGYVMVFKYNKTIKLENYLSKSSLDIQRIHRNLIQIIENIFNSKQSSSLGILKNFVMKLMKENRLLELFCVDICCQKLFISTEIIIKHIWLIQQNIDDKKIFQQKQKVIKQLNNLFNSYYYSTVNLSQIKQKSLIKIFKNQLKQSYQSILLSTSLSQLQNQCNIIIDSIRQILKNLTVIESKQKDDFQFKRQKSQLYLSQDKLDFHEKSTVKKYSKSFKQKSNKKNQITLNPKVNQFNLNNKKVKEKNIKLIK